VTVDGTCSEAPFLYSQAIGRTDGPVAEPFNIMSARGRIQSETRRAAMPLELHLGGVCSNGPVSGPTLFTLMRHNCPVWLRRSPPVRQGVRSWRP
jgi:hypothetical protein